MIKRIKGHPILSGLIEDTCCENEVCVTFDDDIPRESYVIIKVDKYYNSLKGIKIPPSVDCLIIRKCENMGYGLTLVELKNIHTSARFETDNLEGKFATTLYDFIKGRFKNPLDIDYKDVKLFFVSNIEIYKRDFGLKLEVLINLRFNFNDRKIMVTPRMPTPSISKCY